MYFFWGWGIQAENIYIIGGFLTTFYVVLRGAHLCERFSSYFRFYNSYSKIVFSSSHLLLRCARDTHRVVYTTEEWMFPKAILTISFSSLFDLNCYFFSSDFSNFAKKC